jgi:hypothetical protein
MVCGEEVEDGTLPEHAQENHTPDEFQKVWGSMLPNLDPIVRKIRGENFLKQYATGCEVGFSEFDFRIDIMNERLNHPPGTFPESPHQEVIHLISEGQVIVTPNAAKALVRDLGKKVEEFEELFGTIRIDDGQRKNL